MKLTDLIAAGPVLADGAWGTEMQKRGVPVGECPDGFNLSRPESVAAVARSYVEAGSRVILTNTFRANRIALAACGMDRDILAINRAGVAISRQAAAGRAHVFASMGPIGKRLAAGEVNEAKVLAAFEEQAAALAEGGADALLIETMSDVSEAALALGAARKTGLPVIVSFSFDTRKSLTPEQAARRMREEGADAVGANCGVGIAAYVPICRRLRSATSLPIWIKPNAGLPEMRNGNAVYGTTPEEFASFLPALAEAGADFLGGCCGTSPDFIRAAKVMVKR
jgi:methionine synthase I (cobalamin-dependent)